MTIRMWQAQHGAALVVALMMLLAVLALGLGAAEVSIQGERAARNDRDRQVAFQAAEAALLDAETEIETGTRGHLFAPNNIAHFVDGCGTSDETLGLCLRSVGPVPAWQTVEFLNEAGPSVPYGRYTGQTLQVGQAALPTRLPRYVIEVIPYTGPGSEADRPTYFYRITAIGFGARHRTQVVLQTFYRKAHE